MAQASLNLDFERDAERLRTRLPMSEEDFVSWYSQQEYVRAEWDDGEVNIVMAPVSSEHDSLQWWVQTLMKLYAQRKDLGEVKGPQFVSRLTRPGKRVSRREADILLIEKSRLHLLKANHFEGSPDLIVEIVSPESQSRDWRQKYLEYQAAGVREYWIVDPLGHDVEAHALDGQTKAYRPIAQSDRRIASTVIPGFYLRPEWLWKEKLPDVLTILAELNIR